MSKFNSYLIPKAVTAAQTDFYTLPQAGEMRLCADDLRPFRAAARYEYKVFRAVNADLLAAIQKSFEKACAGAYMTGLKPLQKAFTLMADNYAHMRSVQRVMVRPDPPRVEPVSADFNPREKRHYGGVSAARLARVAAYVSRLTKAVGQRRARLRRARLSSKLSSALSLYKRVKTLIAKFGAAINDPAHAISPRPARADTQDPKVRTPAFRWDPSPHAHYDWAAKTAQLGYDPRQTSLFWLQRQSSALRRAIYHEHHGVQPRAYTGRKHDRVDYAFADRCAFEPCAAADQLNEIWPPIDLRAMIPARDGHESNSGPETARQQAVTPAIAPGKAPLEPSRNDLTANSGPTRTSDRLVEPAATLKYEPG